MSVSINTSNRLFRPAQDTRMLLVKWVVALLVPLAVFNWVWQGDALINNVFLGFINPGSASVTNGQLVEAVVFIFIFYLTLLVLAGYLVAADSGRGGIMEVWIAILIFTVVPILLITVTDNLIIGVALCGIVWPIYFILRSRVKYLSHLTSPPLPARNGPPLSESEQRAVMVARGRAGGFWFASSLAVVWLIVDLIFFVSGQLPPELLAITAARTILLPIAGYFLGQLGGMLAVRRAIGANGKGVGNSNMSRRQKAQQILATSRVSEETRDVVPNDLPLRSTGARNFFLILLVAFVIFYPVLDPFLFGAGTDGRLGGYNTAGYYVILALGLNIVVGFAGLLDLGYVAFFAIGAYTWGIVGSTQLGFITSGAIHIPYNFISVLFWPMLLVTALVAAGFGVLLGAPTLRLRGDYLAIVTLGFGEIVPIVFLNLDNLTNGTNGIVGVHSPAFFGISWSQITPIPYYYLILVLIGLTIFANIRLRDSRLGRAWIAIREDEIAASSSGVNLVRTKLFAFGAGAFFSGIAGAYYSAKLGGVSPDTFGFGDSVVYLSMVVIGGIGSIPGVIVGALTVYSINLLILNQLDSLAANPANLLHSVSQFIVQIIPGFTFGNIRNLIFGVVLIVIMIFRPEGLIPSARRRRELHRSSDLEAVELGALDVPTTDPSFETEVRIE